MSQLKTSRPSVFRKVWSRAAVGLFAAVFTPLLLGGTTLGAVEVHSTELAEEITKAEKTIAPRVKRTISRNSMCAVRLRALRRTGRARFGLRPSHFHVRHSLPNGQRAPLRC